MSQAHNGAFSKSVEDSEDVENELGKWVAHSGSHLGIDKMHRNSSSGFQTCGYMGGWCILYLVVPYNRSLVDVSSSGWYGAF